MTPKPLRTPKGTFPPGVSGNPAGKPKGLRSRNARLAQAFAEAHAGTLLHVALMGAGNDPGTLRFLLERIFPKDWSGADPAFPLGDLATPADVRAASDRVMGAHEAGELSAEDATRLHAMLRARMSLIAPTAPPQAGTPPAGSAYAVTGPV